MSKHTRTSGGIGLAVVALAALGLAACTEYEDPRKGPPHVIGVEVADLNFNEAVPPDPPYNACTSAYPQPDPARIQPGLCGGLTSLCPVTCYPPRTGPGFAPLYLGGGSVSYPCDPAFPDSRCTPATGGTFTATIPAGEVYTLTDVPVTPYQTDFQFGQIRILFNKLMDPASIQPDYLACVPAAGITITEDGVDVTADFDVCYVPNSPTPAWGASMTLTPVVAGALTPGATYQVTATVRDQEGASLPVDVTVHAAPDPVVAGFLTVVNATTVDLAWPASAGAVEYDVQRADDTGGAPGAFTTVSANQTAVTFTDTVAATPQYWYRVVARAANGAQVIGDADTIPNIPGTPTFTNVTATSLVVGWPAATYATNYNVQRAPDVNGQPGTWTTIATGVAALTYTDATVATGTTYWYRIVAVQNVLTWTQTGPAASVATP